MMKIINKRNTRDNNKVIKNRTNINNSNNGNNIINKKGHKNENTYNSDYQNTQ